VEEPLDVRSRRLAAIAAAARAYEKHVDTICSTGAVARLVRSHAVDWLGFELVGVDCVTSGAAAEAALLLAEDRVPVDEVAGLCGSPIHRRRLRLDEAEGDLRGRLAGARIGDVVGPLAGHDRHWVWLVTGRQAPATSDPEVVRRAREAMVRDDAERRRAGRVVWHDRH
jgi:hypothetical protein